MNNFNGVIEKKENLWRYLFGFVVIWIGVWSYVRMNGFVLGRLSSPLFLACHYGRMLVYII